MSETDKNVPQLDNARWLAWKERGRKHDRDSRKLQRLAVVVISVIAAFGAMYLVSVRGH